MRRFMRMWERWFFLEVGAGTCSVNIYYSCTVGILCEYGIVLDKCCLKACMHMANLVPAECNSQMIFIG